MKLTNYADAHNIDLSGGVGVVVYNSEHVALGSNTPKVESGSGTPGIGPQASAWDHVHPALAGSSTSFGSNSNSVGTANSAGASSSNSRADHIHKGVSSLAKAGSAALVGDVTLTGGSNVTLTQAGNDISIASTGGGGGSAVDWTAHLNLSGASFTGFTANSGTWSSNGTEIIQTDTSATQRRAYYTTLFPIGFSTIIEVEAQVVSIGAGGFYRAGVGVFDGANNTAGLIAYIDRGAGSVVADVDSAAGINSASTTINLATFYKIRLVFSGWWVSVYLDGTLKFNGIYYTATTSPRVASQYVGLTSYAASVKFRNFKVWTLSTGAPA